MEVGGEYGKREEGGSKGKGSGRGKEVRDREDRVRTRNERIPMA